MNVPAKSDGADEESVPVSVETVLGPKPMLYTSYVIPLHLAVAALYQYAGGRGYEGFLWIFATMLVVMALLPLLYLRSLPRMIERRRVRPRSRGTESAMLALAWVAGVVFPGLGVWGALMGHVPWPAVALGLVPLVPTILGTEAHLRDRRGRSS